MDRAQEIGLFRWRVISEAVDASLSARERGALVRALAAREHLGLDGRWVRISRNTLDRWIGWYREGGFDALVPAPRRMANQTPGRLVELAVSLRREQPARTAAQIHRIIIEAEGRSPTARCPMISIRCCCWAALAARPRISWLPKLLENREFAWTRTCIAL